jgi:hypothetical protein
MKQLRLQQQGWKKGDGSACGSRGAFGSSAVFWEVDTV